MTKSCIAKISVEESAEGSSSSEVVMVSVDSLMQTAQRHNLGKKLKFKILDLHINHSSEHHPIDVDVSLLKSSIGDGQQKHYENGKIQVESDDYIPSDRVSKNSSRGIKGTIHKGKFTSQLSHHSFTIPSLPRYTTKLNWDEFPSNHLSVDSLRDGNKIPKRVSIDGKEVRNPLHAWIARGYANDIIGDAKKDNSKRFSKEEHDALKKHYKETMKTLCVPMEISTAAFHELKNDLSRHKFEAEYYLVFAFQAADEYNNHHKSLSYDGHKEHYNVLKMHVEILIEKDGGGEEESDSESEEEDDDDTASVATTEIHEDTTIDDTVSESGTQVSESVAETSTVGSEEESDEE